MSTGLGHGFSVWWIAMLVVGLAVAGVIGWRLRGSRRVEAPARMSTASQAFAGAPQPTLMAPPAEGAPVAAMQLPPFVSGRSGDPGGADQEPVADAPTQVLAPETSLFHGAWRVGEVLGQGGFGITYRAVDTVLRREVAIKEFFPSGCVRRGSAVTVSHPWTRDMYAKALRQFVEEAEALTRFAHLGIVRVISAFEENGTGYLVMELLQGSTLEALLWSRGPMPVSMAVSYVTHLGEALQAVHAAGLLHRDVKPANVMLTQDGRVVLIDFGTARQFAAGVTQSQSVMLTPGYAPLEQYSERGTRGPFTDVYGLAGTLYFLLTGVNPVSATDRVVGVPLPSPSELRPEVNTRLSQVIFEAMTLEPAARTPDVPMFLTAVTEAARYG